MIWKSLDMGITDDVTAHRSSRVGDIRPYHLGLHGECLAVMVEGQETDTEANVPSQMTARFRHTKSLIHSSIPVAGHCGHA